MMMSMMMCTNIDYKDSAADNDGRDNNKNLCVSTA